MKTSYIKFIVFIVLQNLTFIKGGFSQTSYYPCPNEVSIITTYSPSQGSWEPGLSCFITDKVTYTHTIGTKYRIQGGSLTTYSGPFTNTIKAPGSTRYYELYSPYLPNDRSCYIKAYSGPSQNCFNSSIKISNPTNSAIDQFNKGDLYISLDYVSVNNSKMTLSDPAKIIIQFKINGQLTNLSAPLSSYNRMINDNNFDFSKYIKPGDKYYSLCAVFPKDNNPYCNSNITQICKTVIIYNTSVTDVDDNYINNRISFLPNPNNGSFIIESDLTFEKIVLTDISGKQETFDYNSNITTSLKGVLIATVFYQNGMTSKHKIITY